MRVFGRKCFHNMGRGLFLMKRKGITFLTAALLGAAALLPVSTANAVAGPGTADYNLSGNTTVTNGQNVFVAEAGASASAKSTAEFTVQSGPLQLVAVPDLNFGQANLSTLMNGGTQALANNGVNAAANVATSKNKTAFDGNSAGKLIVNDLRGSTGGWTLSTAFSGVFKAINNPDLNNITLSLSATGANQVAPNEQLNLAGTNIGATALNVATAGATQGKGATTWTVSGPTNASLTIPAQSANISANAVYQSDIVWTLIAGA
jgi:hypothetical protein